MLNNIFSFRKLLAVVDLCIQKQHICYSQPFWMHLFIFLTQVVKGKTAVKAVANLSLKISLNISLETLAINYDKLLLFS